MCAPIAHAAAKLTRSLALSLALALAAAPASAEGEAGPAAANHVAIDNFVFTPAELTVKVGTTVTWTNDDDIPHVVLANDHRFRSKALDTGDGYSYTFAAAGRFDYFCALHPHMVGAIVVVP